MSKILSLKPTTSCVVGIRLSREIKVTPCLVKMQSFPDETWVTSPRRKPGRCYKEFLRSPRPGRTNKIQIRIQGITFGTGLTSGNTRKLLAFEAPPVFCMYLFPYFSMLEHSSGNLKLGFSFPLMDGLPVLSSSVYPKLLDLLVKGHILRI